jgi:hypothetical protein
MACFSSIGQRIAAKGLSCLLASGFVSAVCLTSLKASPSLSIYLHLPPPKKKAAHRHKSESSKCAAFFFGCDAEEERLRARALQDAEGAPFALALQADVASAAAAAAAAERKRQEEERAAAAEEARRVIV